MPPKMPKSTPKPSKSSLVGAQNHTSRHQVAETGPMQKTYYLLWFIHIIQVQGPSFSKQTSTQGPHVHRNRSFSHFGVDFWCQWATQDAKGTPAGAQKDSQGLPRGTLCSQDGLQNLEGNILVILHLPATASACVLVPYTKIL